MWSQCRIFECQTLWYVKLPVGFKRLNYKNWVFYLPLHHWGQAVNTAYQPTSGVSELPHPDFQQSFNSRSFRQLRLALNGWMTNVEWIRKDVKGISRGVTEGTIPKFPWLIWQDSVNWVTDTNFNWESSDCKAWHPVTPCQERDKTGEVRIM
jgi:hypothetical protein